MIIAISAQLGLNAAQTSSWMFVANFCAAFSSVGLSLVYRQPIPIAWSIPGIIYLGTLAGRFSFAEIAGANLMAGVVILALGLSRVGGRIMALLPLPLAMGMFAGSTMASLTALVRVTVEDVVVAGATVMGYLVGRALPALRVPPLAVALLAGGTAVAMTQRTVPAAVSWEWPSLIVPEMQFSAAAFGAISLPLVVLSVGLGNAQGLGFLLAQGYRVPTNVVTVLLGVASIVNAAFGGHQAIVARAGAAMLASSEAGPLAGRYWANVVAGGLTFLLAFAAMPIASLLTSVPASLIIALAGLAILSAFQEALMRMVAGRFRFGSVVAFIVAATSFDVAGITSAFWALLAGLFVSLLVERHDFATLGAVPVEFPLRA